MVIEFKEGHYGYRLFPCIYLENNNPTNGDIIKAMFPSVEVFIEEDCPHIVNISLGGYVIMFQDMWWNAPYKTESEDEK